MVKGVVAGCEVGACGPSVSSGQAPFGYRSGQAPFGYRSGQAPFDCRSGQAPFDCCSGQAPFDYRSGQALVRHEKAFFIFFVVLWNSCRHGVTAGFAVQIIHIKNMYMRLFLKGSVVLRNSCVVP